MLGVTANDLTLQRQMRRLDLATLNTEHVSGTCVWQRLELTSIKLNELLVSVSAVEG